MNEKKIQVNLRRGVPLRTSSRLIDELERCCKDFGTFTVSHIRVGLITAGQHRTPQDSTGLHRTLQDSTGLHRTLQDTAVHRKILQETRKTTVIYI